MPANTLYGEAAGQVIFKSAEGFAHKKTTEAQRHRAILSLGLRRVRKGFYTDHSEVFLADNAEQFSHSQILNSAPPLSLSLSLSLFIILQRRRHELLDVGNACRVVRVCA
jgi:hypothetical protein